MKITKIMNAAISATKDRQVVTRGAKGKYTDAFDNIYYRNLEKESGPSTHNIKSIIRFWYKAYQANMDRLNLVDSLNAPFKKQHKSFLDKIL